MRKRLETMILALAMALSITACSGRQNSTAAGKSENTPANESSVVVQTASKFAGGSIYELKQMYGVENALELKPFYNVEQGTTFTFHFNSYVNPFTAVTVHTDKTCGMDSMVYQYNAGYTTGSGIDVVVAPYQPVLDFGRNIEYGNWGFAPIYYLCIRYDMYSTTPQKLDEPLIVPFTVRNSISVPNVEGKVLTDGTFALEWSPVDGAVSYNIYSAYASRRNEDDTRTRQELGYSGDHPTLLTTVDANTTMFTDFALDGADNALINDDLVSFQNYNPLDNYYVTAVDASGNESYYSIPVESWQYANRLPYTFDKYSEFKTDDDFHITELPEVVTVKMVDGSSAQYPIDYRMLSPEYDSMIYAYKIVNTRLTGTVTAYFEDNDYPLDIKSSMSFDTARYDVESDVEKIPSISANTISGENYVNTTVNLGSFANRGLANMVGYTRELGLVRADIENARAINDGTYGESNPFTMIYDNPALIGYTDESGERIDNSLIAGTYRDITLDGGTGVGNTINYIEVDGNVVYEAPSGERTEVPVVDESTISREDYETHEVPEEITSDNVVEEQLISTEQQVAEANEEEVPVVNYVVFADSAEEDYLARAMIAAQEEVDLSAFPKLQNAEYLIDVFHKIYYQNPYILGIQGFNYDPNTRIASLTYALSADDIASRQAEIADKSDSIISSIINDSMSDEQKIMALWKYLEDNTAYDKEALEVAQQTGFGSDVLQSHPDAFNTYGVMVKGVGVCQSYSMTMKLLCELCGVECRVLTGYMSGDLPHAWNVVNLDGKWYWIDATNNKTNMGIPYYVYQTSSNYAEYCGYVADDLFDLDSNLSYIKNEDNAKDYYAEQGLLFENPEEAVEKLADIYAETHALSIVKCRFEFELSQDLINYIGMSVYERGVAEEEIYALRVYAYDGLLMIIPA